MSQEQYKKQQAAAKQREAQREEMLVQILHPEALERLNRIKLVKPEKARSVGDQLLKAAQRGKLQGRVTDKALQEMLGNLTQKAQTKVSFQRKRYFDEDDSDDNDDDLL